ncbi:hypothetical protein [Nonomuraea basaltis]|uniref:hypothetical protein n=1 Tax=Nonomuraea basaltis TaxID=2495887 RepID=UPI00110C5503|nr:hypothetical protein [Nonomuraea basaltis]TMR90145.1 hypothetical protein EJK15_56890 [Nonomuraea basaltis]
MRVVLCRQIAMPSPPDGILKDEYRPAAAAVCSPPQGMHSGFGDSIDADLDTASASWLAEDCAQAVSGRTGIVGM